MSPEEIAHRLAFIEKRFEEHVAYLGGVARAAPPGGGPAWDAALAHYGVAAESPAFRQRAAGEMRLAAGALPVELKRAIEAVAARAKGEIEQLEAHDGAVRTHARYGPVLARLVSAAANETARYEATVRPKAAGGGGVGSLFANAKETSKKTPWGDFKVEAARTLHCPACNAPQEATLNFICRYCGASLGGDKTP